MKQVPTVKEEKRIHQDMVWLSSQEMDTTTQVQTLDEADSVSLCTNTLGKGMNPILLSPAMGK